MLAGMIKAFFQWNIKICNRIESWLPASFDFSLLELHRRRTAELCNQQQSGRLLDVGGGRSCLYVPYLKPGTDVEIVALDIDHAELAANEHTRLLAVADATIALPIGSDSIDVIVTSSVVEHLKAVDPFAAEAWRVLKPGGTILNVHPCRFSPFSFINRILPERVARGLLYYFFPQWRDACGFKAYYDRCWYSAMRRTFEDNGFTIVEMKCRYYQSIYYKFFVPFYLLMLAYDGLIAALGIRNLCCQILLIAQKK